MALYKLQIKQSVHKELRRIPKKDLQRILARIESFVSNPLPPQAEKLAGEAQKYRIRQGSYRILYQIHDDELVVYVVNVAHRREVYR